MNLVEVALGLSFTGFIIAACYARQKGRGSTFWVLITLTGVAYLSISLWRDSNIMQLLMKAIGFSVMVFLLDLIVETVLRQRR